VPRSSSRSRDLRSIAYHETSRKRHWPLRSAPAAWFWRSCRILLAAFSLGPWLVITSWTAESERIKEPQFKYAGGTEAILAGCSGILQLAPESMKYKCTQYSLTIPYRAIEIMQYRADVSRRVRKLKLKWRVAPPAGGGHKNRYFTMLYRISGVPHVIVLEVPNEEMRPYMAEIDLKCGRRVDVQRHEDYE
jgi:hypothetical protein